MAIEVTMPRLSDTMEEGKILKWYKRVGDEVHKGEVLAEIETDKANMELEAYDSGIVTRIVVDEGGRAPIGEPIAYVGTRDEVSEPGGMPIPKPSPRSAESPTGTGTVGVTAEAENQPPASAAPTQPGPAAKVELPATLNGDRIKASPIAKRLADERGIDLRQVKGTGPGGRIVRDDVENVRPTAVAETRAAPDGPVSAPQALPAVPVPLTRMQETIARRMVASKQQVPHFYVTVEIDTTELTELRKRLNGAGEGVSVSYNDLLVKAVALAIAEMPLLNSSWRDGAIVQNPSINVGVAVAVPRGLLVPVIHDVGSKTVRQIAADAKALIERTRENRSKPEDFQGSTFTISNLGMYDVDEFNAIIDQPAAAIIAVGSIKKKPVVHNDEIAIRERMRVTISCDHRVVYGAEAAEFLQNLKRRIESPYGLVG